MQIVVEEESVARMIVSERLFSGVTEGGCPCRGKRQSFGSSRCSAERTGGWCREICATSMVWVKAIAEVVGVAAG